MLRTKTKPNQKSFFKKITYMSSLQSVSLLSSTTFEQILSRLAVGDQDAHSRLAQLRNAVVLSGIPYASPISRRTTLGDPLRTNIWKILLRIKRLDADRYVQLVKMGPSSQHANIRLDTSRTFKVNIVIYMYTRNDNFNNNNVCLIYFVFNLLCQILNRKKED